MIGAGIAILGAMAALHGAPAQCPSGVPTQTITIVNQAHARPWALAKVENAVVAQSMQLRSAWGTPCVQFAPGGWSVYIKTEGGNGHYVSLATGIPWAEVATGGYDWHAWSQSFSHELIEMLADPSTTRPYTHAPESGNLEIADPVETRAYRLDGVYVSDFVLPAWYAGGTSGVCETDVTFSGDTITCDGPPIAPAGTPGPYDHMSILTGPWQIS